MDIKLSETFRTIWCVLAIQELRDFLSFQTARQDESQTCDNLGMF